MKNLLKVFLAVLIIIIVVSFIISVTHAATTPVLSLTDCKIQVLKTADSKPLTVLIDTIQLNPPPGADWEGGQSSSNKDQTFIILFIKLFKPTSPSWIKLTNEIEIKWEDDPFFSPSPAKCYGIAILTQIPTKIEELQSTIEKTRFSCPDEDNPNVEIIYKNNSDCYLATAFGISTDSPLPIKLTISKTLDL